jgi:hypothetical protein
MGSDVHHDPYHITVMRSQLTRQLGVLYPEVRDEIITAFEELLDVNDNGDVFLVTENNSSLILDNIEWKSVPALTTIQQIVCRVSNRSLVGLPLGMCSLW